MLRIFLHYGGQNITRSGCFRLQDASADKGNCFAWAAKDSSGTMAPFKFDRRKLRPDDVRIQVTYVGMCHSDLHQIRDDWGGSTFPMVPGHECLGVVTEVRPCCIMMLECELWPLTQ